jgi:hypothetical protein
MSVGNLTPTVFDADTYLQSRGCTGLTKRLKTLYDANRLALRLLDLPILDPECRGWMNGPVYVELWADPVHTGDPTTLSAIDRALLDYTLQSLARVSGAELSQRSHEYPEWIAARKGIPASARGNNLITLTAIRSAIKQEVHLENEGATAVIPSPDSPAIIRSMKTRTKEIQVFATVLKSLLAQTASSHTQL